MAHADVFPLLVLVTKGELNVIVRSYLSNVTCVSNSLFTDEGRCVELLGTLPASLSSIIFNH